MRSVNTEVLAFLATRRSRPAKILTGPVPDRLEISALLEMAARSPDHKKLEPWRFVVIEKTAMARLAALSVETNTALGLEPDRVEKLRCQFANADLAVAVIAAPKPNDAVPETEQILSAGAVCLALLNAALASGWGANWLTGAMAFDRAFLSQGLALADSEFVAGFIHIGTAKAVPSDRPRPDMQAKTSWLSQ